MSNKRTVPLVDLRAQYDVLRDRIDVRVAKVLQEGRFILGPEVDELEQTLATLTGAAQVVTVANGTDALKIALMAAEIGSGDAVFVPAFTFVATAEVVADLGGHPVFVDVNPDTLTMDPESLQSQIDAVLQTGTLLPRAIVPVDLFGRPADYPALNGIAARHELRMVADAAQSLGGSIGNRRVGTLAPVTATSFYPSKTLGAYGDGGCLFTDDGDTARLLRSIARHGYAPGGSRAEKVGVNSRLDTLQAAILLAKLEVFEEELAARRRVAEMYTSEIGSVVDTLAPYDGGVHGWSVYSVLSDRRDRLRRALTDEGIATAVYYDRPLHLEPAYEKFGAGPGSLPVSEKAAARILSLPVHPYLDEETVRRICGVVRQALS